MEAEIKSPEYLHVPCEGTGVCYGFDQDWFRGFWQRKAGCGPCTGANILLYFSRGGRLRLPMDVTGREGFLSLMEASWGYLTPGVMGLNSPFMMQKGLDALFASLNSPFRCRAIDIPAEPGRRPDPGLVEGFIGRGLGLDSPVAFLNLANGDIAGLESWHWVTVVGLAGAGEEAVLHIYDNGNRLEVPLRRWLAATKRGGGFVYAEPA